MYNIYIYTCIYTHILLDISNGLPIIDLPIILMTLLILSPDIFLSYTHYVEPAMAPVAHMSTFRLQGSDHLSGRLPQMTLLPKTIEFSQICIHM